MIAAISEKTRVLLVEECDLFRSCMRSRLAGEEGFRVVGEISDPAETADAAAVSAADLVLLHLSQGLGEMLKAIEAVLHIRRPVASVVLLGRRDATLVLPLVAAGVRGVVVKDSAQRDLVRALAAVARGGLFLPKDLVGFYLEEQLRCRVAPDALPLLSAREREVLVLTVEGYSAREISCRLGISPKSVDTYRDRTRTKLGLRHRSEMVRFALNAGLLRPSARLGQQGTEPAAIEAPAYHPEPAATKGLTREASSTILPYS